MKKNKPKTNYPKTIASLAFTFICITTPVFGQQTQEQDLKLLPSNRLRNAVL